MMLRGAFLAIGLFGAGALASASECVSQLRARDAPIHVVGAFSNMRFTAEHAYGYTVELWQSGDCLFGFFLASEGLAGDTPTGLLEDVKFDARTGAISFRARLTLGLLSTQTLTNVPSRDVYDFSGMLRASALHGTLQHTNALLPERPGQSEAIVLKASHEQSAAMRRVATFRRWEREAKEILSFRGPKW